MRRLLGVALVAALAMLSPAAFAQEQSGSIQGVVRDAQGGVLPGVSVEARSAGNVGIRVSVTDPTGVFRFPALPPGSYEFTASLQGFSPARSAAVVALGKLIKVDLTLKIGAMTETVQVTGDAPLIDAKANAATATVSKETIDLIPKGRGLLSVLTQIPGTNNEGRGGGLMIDGASGSENRFLVDGVDRTNARSGSGSAITGTEIVVQDFIDTVQVKQSGYNAEFRAALGGVVNAVTRSGSNKFMGAAATYYTDNKWLGANRPTVRSVPTNGALAESVFIPRTKSHQTDMSFQLGGPIIKDKAWFFVGYAPQYYPSERTVTWAAPGSNPPTQTFSNASAKGDPNNIAWNYNITTQFTSKLRARITGSNETQNGALGLPGIEPNGTSNTSANTFNPRSQVFAEQFQNAYSGIFDYVANNKTYLNMTAGYIKYSTGNVGEYYKGTRRTFSNTNVGLLNIPTAFQNVSGFADNNSNAFTVEDSYQRFNLSADITRFASWKGEHAIKIGGLYERIGNLASLGQQHPNIAFNWDSSYATSDGRSVRGQYGYFTASRIYTGGDIKDTNLSFFTQDQWTVNNKLTVNYGVRLENEEIPSYKPENPGVKFSWGDKIAPRLGFAYDLKGDNKTKAYGSWGVFFDTMKLEMPRGAWGGEKWISYYYTLDTFDWKSIDCTDLNGATCTGGKLVEAVDNRHTSNEPGASEGVVDPDIQPTKKQELTFGVDRELSSVMSLGVRYAHKWWNQTIDDIGVFPPGIQVGAEVYNIGNPGRGVGEYPLGKAFPATPKVLNHYDGLEIVVRKRYSNHWSATSSILFSRQYGNYGGLASSDENGRASPNVSRYYDALYLSFDQKGREANGLLNTDRPLQFKLQGAYTFPFGTNIGLNFQAQSGLIQSSTVTYQFVPIYFNGRGDLGRTPMLNQTDLNILHDFKIKGNTKLALQANIFNVFDQDTATGMAFAAYRDALVLPGPASQPATLFFAGFDTVAVQAARNAASSTTGRPSPLYKMFNAFQGARSIRVMARISF